MRAGGVAELGVALGHLEGGRRKCGALKRVRINETLSVWADSETIDDAWGEWGEGGVLRAGQEESLSLAVPCDVWGKWKAAC